MRTTKRIWGGAVVALCLLAVPGDLEAQPTLEQIMADPDWIGRSPQSAWWSLDGSEVYFEQKVEGADLVDTYRIAPDVAAARVPDDELASLPAARYDRLGERLVWERFGDIYIADLGSGEIRQLTSTRAAEADPFLLHDGASVAYVRDGRHLVRRLSDGLEWQPFEVLFEEDPDDEEDATWLDRQQTRLFSFVRERDEERREERRRREERETADPRRADPPWYLGDDREESQRALSTTGEWLAIVTRAAAHEEGRRDTLPQFVTDDGFIVNEEVRVKVGNAPAPETLVLLHATKRGRISVDLTDLPGIRDDPLAELREAAAEREKAREEEAARARNLEEDPEPPSGDAPTEEGTEEETGDEDSVPGARGVRILDLQWSRDGSSLLLQIFSLDNKDRWVAVVDVTSDGPTLSTLHHRRDEAWINRTLVGAGWLPDSRRIWYTSEESGYNHLYVQAADGADRRTLTSGEFVVSPRGSTPRPHLSNDGRFLYFTANREHPGTIEIYRVGTDSGIVEQLTDHGGHNGFVLSPDESRLLVRHSTATRPADLWIQQTTSPGTAARLTTTVSDRFSSIPWRKPRIVEVPSSRGDRPIYSRLYLPTAEKAGGAAVIFIHGAGYLQNAHHGWSGYFREFMFHTLLVERGYAVLDMDYRASAGYGRDWRTAIYRQMGTPEVEDLEDGVRYLAREHGIDPRRVGAYGGSYGGFLTLMALFRSPDLFAAGAALRPVTDWAHYNHPYTSNILNTPELDPEAYERSSPIEFAEGLEKPLLLCHGVLDDNVLFQDTARLTQRLIELGKRGWETAVYPVERHGFREPSSWLDEYSRILQLFERHLGTGTDR